MSKNLTTILLCLLLLAFLVESTPTTKKSLHSEKKAKHKRPLIERENHPKEYYDELVAKGMLLDNLTQGQPPYPFYGKMDYAADKKRRESILKEFHKKKNFRRLAYDEQTLENLGFIGLKQNFSSSQSTRVMSYIANSVKKDESKFILYPYPFEYVNKSKAEPETVKVDEGGVFTLNQTGLKDKTDKFAFIENITSVKIGKAKGVYDIDIAILSLVYRDSEGREQDLFTNAYRICEYFTNSIAKTSTCLADKNAYLEYKLKYPNKGAVVKVSAVDLLNKTLYDPDTLQLKFKLLIVPDYLTANEETILSTRYLTQEAVDVIKKFRELGGHIISLGKSGYLLQLMGILPEETYDKNFVFGTRAKKQENVIYGCQELYKKTPEEQSDFLKQLICLGYRNRTVLLETYKVNKVPDTFESLIKYTNKENTFYKKDDGYTSNIEDRDITFDYILVSKEDLNKGRIFLVNGNPEQNFYYFDNVRNMILYCMTKDYIYDLKIKFSLNEESDEDLPIPGGEEGVQLVSNFKFYNLYDTVITDFNLEILFAKKIKFFGTAPEGCTLKVERATKYEGLNLTDFDLDKYLVCTSSSISKLNSIGNKFKLEITDYTVTSKLIDIPFMYSSLSFKSNGKETKLNPGIFYAQAALAALLRGTINKDPTSFYPMLGKGLYFDLVITVENKENTIAKDVNYISLVPLVSPLVDGEDEGLIAHTVPVYENYYRKHKFVYPWVSYEEENFDYIDYAEIAGKNVCYVDDFDTPVKLGRSKRSDVNHEGISKEYTTMTYDEKAGPEKGVSPNTLLKQVYFGTAKQFYETAAPRKSLFIDTSTNVGASAYYGSDPIPEEEQDKDDPTKARVHLAFIRLDTYFYKSTYGQYQLPNGFNEKILISIDKFEQDDAKVNGKAIGEVKGKIKTEGHYNINEAKYNTLKPNEYYNSMRQYEYMVRYDPTKPEDLKKLQDMSTDKIALTHFMCPNKDPSIHRAGNIYGFEEDADQKSGSFKEYPSIKFIFGHSIDLNLDPEVTRLGGFAEIKLPTDVDFKDAEPVEADRITTSADNVAFYKNVYDKTQKTIKLYFRRGLMPNENYGLPSKCQVFLENLNKAENFTVTINIYDLKYDFSAPNFESYYKVDNATVTNAVAFYRSFFSFPCLYIENKVSRKSSFAEETSDEMYEYELMNPFARYGGYFQELTKHTTVYGSAEAHHVTDPGFQGLSGGFSLIHNIGTSSIPFAEFLNHATLAIPGVTSTSRLEWTDIWGRRWGQNLRSIYPDIPPIPPVPLSFIMTTTFELITNDKNQERVIEWQSDESVYIRVQMKMRNTYKLYWEPVLCLKNQIPIIKKTNNDYANPIFINDESVDKQDSSIGDDWDVNLGFSSVYGECYDENSYIAGQKLTAETVAKMKDMMTCAESLDPLKMKNCSEYATAHGLPVVQKRPADADEKKDESPKKTWNYSPLIENYLPEGYISSGKMWDLTLEDDYWDDAFYKGYPWHLDDCIPNFDNSIVKPHDIIAFPIYKGLGYNISYSPSYSLKKFPEYKGWWSDQLQNKDHTLLAGQDKVSQVSVGQKSLIDDSKWINGYDLQQTDAHKGLIDNRLKNIYVCLFNRHRVKITPGQSKYAFLKNVYQNNVIPILPDLKENDSRYTNLNCADYPYQYDNKNISQVDNRVYTGNDRDWLYFAAGLRAYAMEDINVILKLDPMESTKYEGITKIQDGGRFTYWQPPDGPNSYQYYDGNVNTVIGKRVDLDILGSLYPSGINTFNTYLFELFEIQDEKEKDRTYNLNTYMNSHGYGDSTTTVYVGGTDATSCRVEPGTFTYVKIVFYNNAGFDWKMKKGAIEYDEAEYSLYLNGMSIMLDKATAIQFPKKYNFMTYEIPPEIAPYVTLSPSQHVVDISPQFYDLTFNNILTIKDALEGDYYYCLNVSSSFPNHLKGKFWEIKMTFNENWFETFPSEKDVTKIHDYHLTIPSIRFGVPISDEGENKGKIFYNLGQAKDMYFTFRLYNEFEIQGIKIISDEDIDELKNAIQDEQNKINNLLKLWDKIPEQDSTKKIKITSVPHSDQFYNFFTFNLSEAYPLFPYEEAANKPFVTKLNILVKSYSVHAPFGYRNILTSSKVNYNDGRKIKKKEADHSYINIYCSGPHFAPTFTHKIVEYDETTNQYVQAKNQEIFTGDELTIKLTLTATNEGTNTAYEGNFNLKIDKDAQYIQTSQTTNSIKVTEGEIRGDEKTINIVYGQPITAKDYRKFDLYFKVQFGDKDLENIKIQEVNRRALEAVKTTQFKLVKGLDMTLCVVENCNGEKDPNFGRQKSDVKHNLSYKVNVIRDVGKISLAAKNVGTIESPKYELKATVSDLDSSYNLNDVQYVFYRKIEGKDDDYKVIGRSAQPEFTDEPFANMKDIKYYKVSYKVIGQFSDGRTIDSTSKDNLYEDSHDEPEKDGNGFPAYAIALIVILGAAAIAGSSLLVYKLFTKKAVDNISLSPSESPEMVKSYAGEQSYKKVDTTSTRIKKRSIGNKKSISQLGNNGTKQ